MENCTNRAEIYQDVLQSLVKAGLTDDPHITELVQALPDTWGLDNKPQIAAMLRQTADLPNPTDDGE